MKNVSIYLGLTLLAVFLAMPFVWSLFVSLHESRSAIPEFSKIVPGRPHWENYKTVVLNEQVPVLRFFINSLIVSVFVVIGQLFVCSSAAFALARLPFRGRDLVFALFLGTMMFSGTVVQVPLYLIVRQLSWLDTYFALIMPSVGSAFGVFLLRQFFLQIPREIDEAARLDGANEWTLYWKLLLPVSKPALGTLGAFAFIATWTDFFWPLIATSSLEMRTVEVGLSIFKNSYGGTNWPLQNTAAVVALIPVLVVFLCLQRFFVRGITLGSGK
ncbi:MAG: carbohydrate ABC transporter permease [Chthonomonadaceae bacterium]|nr:carbohydrate ABC transporter permease [Chthonomonadaceae bacterium]